MILGVEVFPDDWEQIENKNWDAAFENSDQTIVVLIAISIRSSVPAARRRFDRLQERYEANELSFADEAFWAERPDNAQTMFRHSNAIGECLSARKVKSGWIPAITRSQVYAADLFEQWGSL